jgi:hypothetical protein
MPHPFRRISADTVMCTEQGCPRVAAFVYMGAFDSRVGKPSVVAAYCDAHAMEAARRMGQPLPLPERRRAAPMVRAQSA